MSTLAALQDKGHETIAVGIDRAGALHLVDPTLDPLVADGPAVSIEIPGGRYRTHHTQAHTPRGTKDTNFQRLAHAIYSIRPTVGNDALHPDETLTHIVEKLANAVLPATRFRILVFLAGVKRLVEIPQ